MEILLQDLRYAVRMMFREFGFTVLVIITLALGIGANTAIFSVVNTVLLRSLPFSEPERVVLIWMSNPRLKLAYKELPAPPADFIDWRDQNSVFDNLSAFSATAYTLTGTSEPERIDGVQASADFFSVLGVRPEMGRTFTYEEDQPGKAQVSVISNGFWKRRFGGDPNIIDKVITLDGQSYTVIGVMPEGFEFPQGATMPAGLQFPPKPEVWTPIAFDNQRLRDRSNFSLAAIGRLKPGVSLEQARADMNGIAERIDQQFRRSSGFGTTLVEMREQIVGDMRFALIVLMGAVGSVLLIACSNVANLLLAKSTRRQKELAIRTAMGAGRLRLVRQMLTETMLLALAGGGAGLLLANWGTGFLLAISPDSIPRAREVSFDFWVFAFALGASLLTGILSGIVPSLQASRTDINTVLKEESLSSIGTGRSRHIRSLLVVSQVSIALVLLIGAGLLVKSFVLLQRVSIGFKPDNVLTMQLALPGFKYPAGAQQVAFFNQLLQRLKTAPGVRSAGVVTNLPLSGAGMSTNFTIEGRPVPPPRDRPMADYTAISPDLFDAMGIVLMKGRSFTDQDTATSPGVVIINETMANRFWPDEDVIGKALTVSVGSAPARLEIIGIVADVKGAKLSGEPMSGMYVPYTQSPQGFMFLVARTTPEPLSMASTLTREVYTVDKDQPVSRIKSMSQVIADSESNRNFNTVLLTLFAGLALTLAVLGVYGVIAYSVNQRKREIGIRMALGAQQRDVVGLILKQGMVLILIGISIGLVAAFILAKFVSSLLYQVSAWDAATFVLATLALTVAAVLPVFIPAFKATSIDPMTALKQE